MRVEVVAIGNELLNGDLADTNTRTLARMLRERGLSVRGCQIVPDEPPAITRAFADAATRSDLVLVSGGLGPTTDDLTMAVAAAFAGQPLVTHEPTLTALRERFAARGHPFTANNAKQAEAPRGAAVLANPVGTAPGVRLEAAGATFFFFPGVPHELARLAADHLLPWLEARAAVRPYRSHVLKTFGQTESKVGSLLEPLPVDPRVHVGYRASFPEIIVSLHVTEDDPALGSALLTRYVDHTRALLGGLVYTEDPDETLAAAVGRRLAAQGATVATAESCTGGLVAGLITSAPGSSAWFSEAAVTYSNAAKSARLGVPAALIAAHGAVSEPVARAMAEGIRERAGATYGVGVTGVAGPDGGTADKPVGTVHIAVASAQRTWHVRRRLPFDRERNRVVSAWSALDMVRRFDVVA